MQNTEMSVLSVCVLECVKRETGKQEEDRRADNFRKEIKEVIPTPKELII